MYIVEECITVGDVYEIKEAGWNRAHWVSLVGLWGLWFLQSLLFFTNSAKACVPSWFRGGSSFCQCGSCAVEHRRRCCSKTDILRAAIGDGFNSLSSSTQRPTMAHLDPDTPPVHETSSSGEHVSFEVTLHEDAGKSLLVTITPPREPKQPGRRAPLDLCLVINVSRSMSALIEGGKFKESKGLNVLDVVKHACRTILSTMQDDNRLSVVTFTKEVRVSAHPRDDGPT